MPKIKSKYIKKISQNVKMRLKALKNMGHSQEERFIPDEGLNEPEFKEGFSLPWISGERLRLNDRLILDWCHYIEVILLLLLLASLYLVKNKEEWEPLFQMVLLVVLVAGAYRRILFEKLNKNLQAITEKTRGQFVPGNSILSASPQVRFDYLGQDCYVRTVIDQNFRLVLEISSYFGKEFEFRIEKPQEEVSDYIVFGQDRATVLAVLKNQKVNEDLQKIFKSFNYLSYGKDGMMHIGELFDGRLTDPKIIFDMLDRMISFGKLLKLHER